MAVLPVWALVNSLVCEMSCAGSHGEGSGHGHAHGSHEPGHGHVDSGGAHVRAAADTSDDWTAICPGCADPPSALNSTKRGGLDAPLQIGPMPWLRGAAHHHRDGRLLALVEPPPGWTRNPPLLL